MTIKYTDNYGKKRTLEVPDDTAENVLKFLQEEEQRANRQKARNGYWLEHLDMPEEKLYHRAAERPVLMDKQYEETDYDNQLCGQAMDILMKYCTPIQRGRFYLHVLYGIPTETIAYWQGCSVQAVRRSIHTALEQLQNLSQK